MFLNEEFNPEKVKLVMQVFDRAVEQEKTLRSEADKHCELLIGTILIAMLKEFEKEFEYYYIQKADFLTAVFNKYCNHKSFKEIMNLFVVRPNVQINVRINPRQYAITNAREMLNHRFGRMVGTWFLTVWAIKEYYHTGFTHKKYSQAHTRRILWEIEQKARQTLSVRTPSTPRSPSIPGTPSTSWSPTTSRTPSIPGTPVMPPSPRQLKTWVLPKPKTRSMFDGSFSEMAQNLIGAKKSNDYDPYRKYPDDNYWGRF